MYQNNELIDWKYYQNSFIICCLLAILISATIIIYSGLKLHLTTSDPLNLSHTAFLWWLDYNNSTNRQPNSIIFELTDNQPTTLLVVVALFSCFVLQSLQSVTQLWSFFLCCYKYRYFNSQKVQYFQTNKM